MRKLQLTALLLCAAMALPAAGCGNKTKSSSSSKTRSISDGGDAPQAEEPSNVYQNKKDEGIGVNETVVDIKTEADANGTGFSLNRAIKVTPEADHGDNGSSIYLDVTIKNSTDTAYDLSTLNNFYLIYPDGTEKYSDVQTELYANSKFNNFSISPYTVPANGELSCIIGGFAVDSSLNEFTVGFFPTRDNDRDKADVIKVEVKPDMIEDNPTDILK